MRTRVNSARGARRGSDREGAGARWWRTSIAASDDGAENIVSFEIEHQLMQVLGGAHVPRFVAAGDLSRVPYLVMEYVQGRTLDHWLDEARAGKQRLDAATFVSDVVTVPAVPPLIAQARARGCGTMTGTGMFDGVRECIVDFYMAPSAASRFAASTSELT